MNAKSRSVNQKIQQQPQGVANHISHDTGASIMQAKQTAKNMIPPTHATEFMNHVQLMPSHPERALLNI